MGKDNIKILVVDSSPRSRQALVEALSSRAKVEEATRASSAIKQLHSHGFDLVLINDALTDRDDVKTFAVSTGLEFELLYRATAVGATGASYVGLARFGAHKWGLKALKQTGRWWHLLEGDQDTPERYRKILNRVSDGIVEVDAQDSIRWANTSLQRALGDASLAGLSLEQIVKPSDVHQLRTIRQQLAAGVVVPFPVRLASGQLVEVDPTLRFAADGTPNGSSIIFRSVRSNGDSERGRELFALYTVAALLSQAPTQELAATSVLGRILELLELAAAGINLERGSTHFSQGLKLESEPQAVLQALCEDQQRCPKTEVHRNLPSEEDARLVPLAQAGIRGLVILPLQAQREYLGSMWFLSTDPGHFSREVVSLLISISVQLVGALENFRHVEERLQEEASRRRFYRDALQAVTRGKLILAERPEMDEAWEASGPVVGERPIRGHSDIPELRRFVEHTLQERGFSEERCHDMALCATEAAGNVVKHADSGRLTIRANSELVRIRIDDSGPGIHFTHLPKAVLSPGFSTAPSLGMGYSILLELADAVQLSTGEGGTAVILEVSNKIVDPLEAFVNLDLL